MIKEFISSIYETDFNQFYTIWDGSKYAVLIYPFCCSLRNTPINVVEVHSRVIS